MQIQSHTDQRAGIQLRPQLCQTPLHDSDDWYASEPLGIGSISQLNEREADVTHKIPLGFPVPKGEPMTPYRDRLNAGEYASDQTDTPKRKPRKRTTTKRATSKRSTRKR